MKESYVYKPVQFFLITNLITWVVWLAAAYFSYQQGDAPKRLFSAFELAGLFVPLGAALWMILTSNSGELKRNFYHRLLNLRLIKLSSIPAIFLIMPAAVVISVVISWLFFGQSLSQLKISGLASSAAGLIPIPVMFFGAALLEELGWKGYGMDSLRGKRTFFKATLIYAALWVFWHIPLFFINNYYHNTLLRENPLFALNFIISVVPAAFIINWLWYKNCGSIMTAILFHAIANFQGILQMGQIAKCIETGVMIIIGAIIVRLNKKMFFEKFPAQIGYFGQDANGPVTVK